jgi:hypothetical protein
MPVNIDEVTAEVSPPERRDQAAESAAAQPPSPSEVRRQREQFERMKLRAARVHAD